MMCKYGKVIYCREELFGMHFLARDSIVLGIWVGGCCLG